MAKKLFLCQFTLSSSGYMSERKPDLCEYTRLVWALDHVDAERVISEQKEFATDEYSVYRNIRDFDATEVIGTPD